MKELEAEGLRPKRLDQPSAAFRPSHQGAWEFLYDETGAIPKRRSDTLLKMLNQGFGLLAWLVNVISAGIVSVLLGLNPAPASLASVPVINFVLQHQLLSLIIICGLVLFILIGSLLFLRLTSNMSQQLLHRQLHPWSLVTFTSIASFLACFILLIIVILRPPWCPTSLCPGPQRILLTHPAGIHDENLDMYFIAVQGTSYAIPGDPARYTLDNLPRSISALHTDGKNSTLLYHLVIGLESLRQGRFGMTIQEVDLAIQKLSPIPHPLKVWDDSSLIHYENENHYRALYFGQGTGAIIPAEYLRFPNGFVHLKPRENDQIDVHIISRVEADIQFSVRVIYRIDNESELHTLELPQVFEVMFASESDWHLYRLRDGHFVPDKVS